MTFDTTFTTARLRNLRMILSDDEQKRIRKVALEVVVVMLKEAKAICDRKICALDHGDNRYIREAAASECSVAIGALIQQVQGDSNE